MRKPSIHTPRLVALILLHAAGVGRASPNFLVTRPSAKTPEWLPRDNQTLYRIEPGKSMRLELNTSSITEAPVYITISPCTRDVHWTVYRGTPRGNDGHFSFIEEQSGTETAVVSTTISRYDRYVLQLKSLRGGAATVSVRGEKPKTCRLRLRLRSRRRLAAMWDPSPIDPQTTSYCIVASPTNNYTSLCAAHHDVRVNNMLKDNFLNQISSLEQNDTFIDNNINVDTFDSYENTFSNIYRKKKFNRSTRVTDQDPIVVCVGVRTHHLIENLNPNKAYFVSVFGVAQDRRAGTLLASKTIYPRTTEAKHLEDAITQNTEAKGRLVFYYKTVINANEGFWFSISVCGGSVDVEISVKAKPFYLVKNISAHKTFYVPSPLLSTSLQETSDEASLQFDSSSEEARVRYVIKVNPSQREGGDNTRFVEVTASTNRWAIDAPELSVESSTVRELRPRRSCRSVDIAFLPAIHNSTEFLRYCIRVHEGLNVGKMNSCSTKSLPKTQCVTLSQKHQPKVIVQKIERLKPGRKYEVQVMASNRRSSVPYEPLFVETSVSCRN